MLLSFEQLQDDGTLYRLLHGGEKDHGYNYSLRDGRLYNETMRRYSNVPFNAKIKFVKSDEKIKNYESLEYDVEFHSNGVKVGCQNITRNDAYSLAQDLLNYLESTGYSPIERYASEDIPF